MQYSVLVLDKQNRLLFCQRPSQGLLAGLWEPPAAEIMQPPKSSDITQMFSQRYGLKITHPTPLQTVKHAFTHFHLTVYPFICRLESGQFKADGYQAYRWVPSDKESELPLATLHRKLLAQFNRAGSKGTHDSAIAEGYALEGQG